MSALAARKEAIDLIERMPETKLRLVINYAHSLNQMDKREEERKKTLLSLAGSIDDDTFVRPADRMPEERNQL